MTKKRDLKQRIRQRMEKTGERYAAARRHVAATASDDADPRPPTGEPGDPGDAADPIRGWFSAGPTPEAYEYRIDPTAGLGGTASALVRSRTGQPFHGATRLMQQFLAHDYRGSRLRLSGRIRAEALTGCCRLWMRIDENTRLLVSAESSPIAGTCGWTRKEVVLDVDEEATLISIGLAVDGAGAAWLAAVAVERVGSDVVASASRDIPSEPRNLSFRE